jgi:hypothetical protein
LFPTPEGEVEAPYRPGRRFCSGILEVCTTSFIGVDGRSIGYVSWVGASSKGCHAAETEFDSWEVIQYCSGEDQLRNQEPSDGNFCRLFDLHRLNVGKVDFGHRLRDFKVATVVIDRNCFESKLNIINLFDDSLACFYKPWRTT